MRSILVLGYFGFRTNQLDGQTVKTRDVYRLIKEQSDLKVDFFDTQNFKFSKSSILTMFWKVAKSKTLIYLPAQNNLKFIFPILFCLSFLLRVRIHYFVVGGWLRDFINSLPIHRFMLSRIGGIHVETCRLKNELQEYYHFDNVDLFPNFRFFHYDHAKVDSSVLRLCMIINDKGFQGLNWILKFADYIRRNKLHSEYSILIVGTLSDDDKISLRQCMVRFPFISYKEMQDLSNIHDVIVNNDVLVLPMPSTIEDIATVTHYAYFSGIPVISPEVMHAQDYIVNEKSGLIIPSVSASDILLNRLLQLKENRHFLHRLQSGALLRKAKCTSPALNICKVFNIAFVSRVEQSKGLDTLQEIVSILETLNLHEVIRFNLYGSKTDNYFDDNLKSSNLIYYKGVLQPSDVIPTLMNNDALIFPTHYEGEGCPGILVEALSAGLPIIASDWKYNNEFVEDGINGFLCQTFNAQAYVDAIITLYNDSLLANLMSRQSYIKSFDFSVDNASNLLKSIL